MGSDRTADLPCCVPAAIGAVDNLHIKVIPVFLQHIGKLLVVAEENTRHGVALQLICLEFGQCRAAPDPDCRGVVVDLIIDG